MKLLEITTRERTYNDKRTTTRTTITMPPLLILVVLPALLAAAASAAGPRCHALDMRVESTGRDTATISLKPPPGRGLHPSSFRLNVSTFRGKRWVVSVAQ